MNIARLSVTRPVTTAMAFLAIILLGVISLVKLPQELFPSITYPQITVVTTYENAAPEEVESLITKAVEEAVGTVNNVKRISSMSREGSSLVMVEFNWGTNMDFAALNVREKIDLIKEKLPRDSQDPVVMKYNPFDLPVMNISVTGNFPSQELRKICRKYIKDAIEKVEGVASAVITGGDQREILVEINQPRLRASQISIVSIVESLKTANLNYPAGTIKESFYEYLIRTMGEYQKIDEIKDTPTALEIPEAENRQQSEKDKAKEESKGRRLVFLKDISKVKDTVKERTSISRYNGSDNISLVVRKQSGTNTIKVVNGIKKELKTLLESKLPKGVNIQITYDQSKFIQEALGNVRDAGVQGSVLAFIVLFFFLLEVTPSVIITLAIPICIAATAVLMYFFKVDLNIMSLGGLALGVGMVVDNANIVIENIYRHLRELGKNMKDAVIDGTQEMVSAIIGSTLTNIAVFLPFSFVIGIAGQIFKQLSFTITFSLIASIIVAVSLVPMLVSLNKRKKSGAQPNTLIKKLFFTEQINDFINSDSPDGFTYGNFITRLVDNRNSVIIGVGILFFIALALFFGIEKRFLPRVDQRQFVVKVELAPGIRLEITDGVVKKIERALLDMREIKDVTVNIGSSEDRESAEKSAVQTLGSHQAQILVNLKPKPSRFSFGKSTDEVIQELKNAIENQDLEKAEIEYIAQETSLGSAVEQGAPIAIEIKGPDLNQLTGLSTTIQSQLKKMPGIYGVKSSMSPPSPETKLNIRKDKSTLFGLSVREIAITAQVALRGYVATKFKEKREEEDIDVRVRLRPEDRRDLSNLRRLLIHSNQLNADIPVAELAYLTKGAGPTAIRRVDQQRSVIITANVFKRTMTDVTRDINHILAPLQANRLYRDYAISLGGEQQRMKESFASLLFALALAIVLVYMIMAGEFESLWQPLLIMFTVPLSLIGVAFSLFLSRTPLSVVAYLGIIMLGGIAVNNGIVLIEFVNQLRKEGYEAREAVIVASKTRLRPILMTSLTTILGLVPLAFGFGEGSELQSPLAITVMGGLISATFLTLIFIPALYLWTVERFEGRFFAAPSFELDETPVQAAPAPQAISPEELAAKQAQIETLTGQLQLTQEQNAALLAEKERALETMRAELLGNEEARNRLAQQTTLQKDEFENIAREKEVQLAQMKQLLSEKELSLAEATRRLQEQANASQAVSRQTLQQQEEQRRQLAEQLEKLQESYSRSLKEKDALKQEAQARLKKEEQRQAALAVQFQQQQAALQSLQADKERVQAEAKRKIQEQEDKLKKLSDELEEEKKKPAAPAAAPAPKTEPEIIPLPAAAPLTAPLAQPAAVQPLNPRQIELLEKLKTMTKITRKEYADMFAVSVPTAARDLKELVDQKLLSAQGPLGPGRWYQLTRPDTNAS